MNPSELVNALRAASDNAKTESAISLLAIAAQLVKMADYYDTKLYESPDLEQELPNIIHCVLHE